jgi:hypothetical protein
VGTEGWIYLADGLKTAHDKGRAIKLRSLKLEGCKIKEDARLMLEDAVMKTQPTMRIDFGPLDEADDGKKLKVFCC